MNQSKTIRNISPNESREVIIAYLSYALKDVRALSEQSLHFLELSIAALSEDRSPEPATGPLQPNSFH